MTPIPREVVDGFHRVRAVALEAWSAEEIIRELDALERTVSQAMGGMSPETRPVIPATNEKWG